MTVRINDQYFSGAQASMFIGDTWVDDVVSLSVQVQHNRQPVYGYGSQHWDFIPKGTILVMGEFTINFREPNYLWMILERYKTFRSNGSRRTKTDQMKLDQQRQTIAQNNQTFGEDNRRNLQNFFDADLNTARTMKQAFNAEFNENLFRNKPERLNHTSFDISIGYGNLDASSVAEKINNIQIMGKGKVIEADGRPVMESYSFIARDIR